MVSANVEPLENFLNRPRYNLYPNIRPRPSSIILLEEHSRRKLIFSWLEKCSLVKIFKEDEALCFYLFHRSCTWSKVYTSGIFTGGTANLSGWPLTFKKKWAGLLFCSCYHCLIVLLLLKTFFFSPSQTFCTGPYICQVSINIWLIAIF